MTDDKWIFTASNEPMQILIITEDGKFYWADDARERITKLEAGANKAILEALWGVRKPKTLTSNVD